MNVESAVRRRLLADPTVAGYIGGKCWKYRLEEDLNGTSGMAVVVFRSNGWTTPDRINTGEYPLMIVRAYVDPSRDDLGAITVADGPDRAYALYAAVNRVLHGKRGETWGEVGSNPGLVVHSSARQSEPFLVSGDDRHPSDPPLGDMVYVQASYAMEV